MEPGQEQHSPDPQTLRVDLDDIRNGASSETQRPEANTISGPRVVRSAQSAASIYDVAGVRVIDELVMTRDRLQALDQATYLDERWQKAQAHLFGDRIGDPSEEDRITAGDVLREGAKAFGIWHVSGVSLAGLARQVLKEEDLPSPALASWVAHAERLTSEVGPVGELADRELVNRVSMDERTVEKEIKSRQEWQGYYQAIHDGYVHFSQSDVNAAKIILAVSVLISSIGYAIKTVVHTYPDIIEIFGWPIFIARAGGMGCAILTGILYLSMARSACKGLYSMFPRSSLAGVLTGHKDIHIFAGQFLLVLALIHTLGHLIGTAPGVQSHTHEELNQLLGCANPDETPDYIGARMKWLQWPSCPLEEDYTLLDVVFLSTPGLTGLALLLLLFLIAYTGKQKNRSTRFDRFWNLHNVAIFIWPLLVFVHGSNGWVGVGLPLVIFTGTLPIALYLVDRIGRFLRYIFFSSHVRIMEAVIRPGKQGSSSGAVTYLRVTRPTCNWHFRAGEYAVVCMPEYNRFQWHPFTICSGQEDDTVDFLIASVGDWTHELADRVSLALTGESPLPLIALDGPYMAPTQSAMQQKVLVAVGAGVGITPFLSLMATIASAYEVSGSRGVTLKEAHFYWLTRNPDELLFGRKVFAKVVSHPLVRDKVFLHLHLTRQEPKNNAPAFLFREAIRRQSLVDRSIFMQEVGQKKTASVLVGPQVPWNWVNRTSEDVLWLSHLLPIDDEGEETEVLQKYDGKWAQGLLRPDATSSTWYWKEKLSSHHWMMPVIFGRPDFATEVQAIGKARPTEDVNIYVCGNDHIVKLLQNICVVCNSHAEKSAKSKGGKPQRYLMHHERFG